jgi:hypothetical protein
LADRIRHGLEESLAFCHGKKNLRTVVVDEFGVEVARTRSNQELMELLDERAKQPATIPLIELKRRLGLG